MVFTQIGRHIRNTPPGWIIQAKTAVSVIGKLTLINSTLAASTSLGNQPEHAMLLRMDERHCHIDLPLGKRPRHLGPARRAY